MAVSWNDFRDKVHIGTGTFGKVFRVTSRLNDKFAVKEFNRAEMVKRRAPSKIEENVRSMLELLRHRGIVRMFGSFTDDSSTYLVLDYLENGNIYSVLGQLVEFPTELLRQYTAEMVQVLEYLHDMNVVTRSLKPQNILLDSNWHIKLTDFRYAVRLGRDEQRRPHKGVISYMPPEVLKSDPITLGYDLWAFGCIIFEMMTGFKAFPASPLATIEDRIKSSAIMEYPQPKAHIGFLKLVKQLLIQDPHQRLGMRDFADLKRHGTLLLVDWDNLHNSHPPVPQSVKDAQKGLQPQYGPQAFPIRGVPLPTKPSTSARSTPPPVWQRHVSPEKGEFGYVAKPWESPPTQPRPRARTFNLEKELGQQSTPRTSRKPQEPEPEEEFEDIYARNAESDSSP